MPGNEDGDYCDYCGEDGDDNCAMCITPGFHIHTIITIILKSNHKTTGSYMMTVPRMLVLNIVIGPDLMAIVLVTIPVAQTHRMEDGEVVDEKSEQPLITNFNYGHS